MSRFLGSLILLFVTTAASSRGSGFTPDTTPPDTWDAPGAGNPILPGTFADPSLVRHDGKYYLYATIDPWGADTLGCWESDDFKNWTFRELAWPTKAACTSAESSGAMVWAPSVVRAPDGRFVMYVSVGSEVWVGTAPHPLGPWTDANGGRPLIARSWNPTYHMIDAEAFIDDDGSAYLYWGSGWNWTNGRCFVGKLKPDLVTFDGEPRDVTPANYFEAPFLFKHDGRYYLTYSQGKTVTDTYQVHYATGPGPLGPFEEAPNSPILVTDHARHIVSPGHHAMFEQDGRSYILYHRHRLPYVETPDATFRQICLDELHFTADGLMAQVEPTHRGVDLTPGATRTAHRLDARATASSAIDSIHDAAHAIDDNYATRWAPAADDATPWLRLDLDSTQPIDRLVVRFEYAHRSYHPTITTSLDGTTWHPLDHLPAEGLQGSPVIVPVNRPARHIRLQFDTAASDATAAPPAIWEAAVFGPPTS